MIVMTFVKRRSASSRWFWSVHRYSCTWASDSTTDLGVELERVHVVGVRADDRDDVRQETERIEPLVLERPQVLLHLGERLDHRSRGRTRTSPRRRRPSG